MIFFFKQTPAVIPYFSDTPTPELKINRPALWSDKKAIKVNMNTRRCLCAFGQFKQTQSAVVGTQPPMGTALRRMTPLLTELNFL